MEIQNLTWPEVEELFKKEIAILPIGATEQHGPHLPLGTDSFYADFIAKEVGKKLSIAVLPVVPYSVSGFNFPYPTMTIEPETLISYLKDVCKSLKFFGVNKVVFIVGHGGENCSAIDVAAYIISRDFDMKIMVLFPWTFLTEKDKEKMNKDWHAGEMETSDMLYINEKLVRKDEIKKSSVPEPMKWIVSYKNMKKDERLGVLGDPTNASKEKGEKELLNI